jgi:hypothetical protein
MEVRLKISELKVAQEYDSKLGHLVATIKLTSLVDVKDVATLAQLQTYVNCECAMSGDERQLKIVVDKDTGEIGGDV